MKIAVLGPKGTYSDIAKEKYFEMNNIKMDTIYYPSINKTIESLNENDYAIVPFENALDGFIMEVIDRIVKYDLNIIYQLKLPIDFAFIGNVNDINKIKKVYCQFKAYGQCQDFILSKNFDIIKTESNIESLELFKKEEEPIGAIIPIHALNFGKFPLVIPHIADSKNNETRFFLVSKNKPFGEIKGNLVVSILFSSIIDKPGVLYQILKTFHDRNINLNSILSRPSKEYLGSYNFYIECSLNEKEVKNLNDLVEEFKSNESLKISILGIYNSLL